MSKRTLTVSLLTAGLTAGILATAVGPAAAQQGNPVGGHGSVYFLSGAVNDSGKAQKVYAFGDPGDEVYYGDWYGVGEDMPMVRRGNVFYVPKANDIYQTSHIFVYGDRGDTVLVGDWDGDGKDTLSIRRGNQYLVKNDNTKSGKADSEFFYGDSDDVVLVGNWDGKVAAPKGGIDRNNDKDFDDKGAPAYAADLMNRVPAATPGTAFVDNTVPADGDYTDTTIQSLRYQPIADVAVSASGPDGIAGNADDNTGVDNTLPADGDTTDTTLQPLPYQPTADTYIGDPGFDADKDGIYEDGDRVPGTGVDNNGDGDFTDNATAATSGDVAPVPAKGDTLMIQRGNEFFVKNSITTGKADYTFFFGDAGDTILVGDWATAAKAKTKTENAKPAVGANGADQLAVRRDNVYHLSTELEAARTSKTNPKTDRIFAYGDPGDSVLVAALTSDRVDEYGEAGTVAVNYKVGDRMYTSGTGAPVQALATSDDTNTQKVDNTGKLVVDANGDPVMYSVNNPMFYPGTGAPVQAIAKTGDTSRPKINKDGSSASDSIAGDGFGVRR